MTDKIPDAINLSRSAEFTQVPNDLIREPGLSWKAKGIMSALLSNREGWHSYVSVIVKMGKDGEDSVRSGLKELEEFGYLVRLRYRCKKTKQFKGTLWGYTDIPGEMDLSKSIQMLEEHGYELEYQENPDPENPDPENPHLGKPHVGNPGLKILNIKRPMEKEEEEDACKRTPRMKRTKWADDQKITPSMFDEFWAMYPRKVDKGKAKTKWNQICNKRTTDESRPTWGTIKRAIEDQLQSERWQNPRFIPHPTTWLNQQRWLDDPEEMKSSYDNSGHGTDPSANQPSKGSGHMNPKKQVDEGPGPRPLFQKEFGKDLGDWLFENVFKPLRYVFSGPDGELLRGVTRSNLAQSIVHMLRQIQDRQKNLPPDFFDTHPYYGFMSILKAYVQYLEEARSWLDTPTLTMLDVTHPIFGRFRKQYARESDHLARDPFTGLPSSSV